MKTTNNVGDTPTPIGEEVAATEYNPTHKWVSERTDQED